MITEINSLVKKLQIKPGQRLLILNAPPAYEMLLQPLPEDVTLSSTLEGDYDNIHLFVANKNVLITALRDIHSLLQPSTIVWIAYPKKSSSIKSDLDMMSSWDEPEKYGLRPVSSVSIDETWTALRFKPKDQVKKSGVGNAEIQASSLSEFIDVEKRVISLPPDLKAEVERKPASVAFFESLSWTNKKEYVTWILTAKQEKTRIQRVKKAAEMLASKKKNPSAK